MWYLLLAILCGASLALLFRYSESRDMDRLAITASNYLTAAGASLLECLLRHGPTLGLGSLDLFLAEAPKVLGGEGNFSAGAAPWWGIVVGVPAGAIFFTSFMLYQASIRHNGAALSGIFGKLGVLVPTALSAAIFRQLPEGLQWIGVALALIAIVVSQLGSARGGSGMGFAPARRSLLPLLMLVMGLAEFSNKVFQGFAGELHRGVFLLATFSTALFISAAAVIRRGAMPGRADLALGVVVGIPNVLCSYFLIMALSTINATVAFPTYSASGVVVIALGARIIFGDRLSRWQWIAVGLTAAGLALMG